MATKTEQYLRGSQVAKELGINVNTVTNYANKGTLKGVRLYGAGKNGGEWIFTRQVIDEYKSIQEKAAQARKENAVKRLGDANLARQAYRDKRQGSDTEQDTINVSAAIDESLSSTLKVLNDNMVNSQQLYQDAMRQIQDLTSKNSQLKEQLIGFDQLKAVCVDLMTTSRASGNGTAFLPERVAIQRVLANLGVVDNNGKKI